MLARPPGLAQAVALGLCVPCDKIFFFFTAFLAQWMRGSKEGGVLEREKCVC